MRNKKESGKPAGVLCFFFSFEIPAVASALNERAGEHKKYKGFLIGKLVRNTLFTSRNHLPLTHSITLGLWSLDLGEGELNLR